MPRAIAAGADGSAWYTDAPAKQITRLTPDGTFSSVALETPVARLGQWFALALAIFICYVVINVRKRKAD